MGIASASFTIIIRDENPLVLAEGFLGTFGSEFLQPKSIEIHLPGRRVEKVKGSIDAGVFWGKDSLPAKLPGETFVAGTEFTTLERPGDWLALPRDLPHIMQRLREYSEESAQLWRSKQTIDDDVFWMFWGLCRVASGPAQGGYFLRQQLQSAKRLEPILRISSHLSQNPRPEFTIKFFTRSFVWSDFTSSFDAERQQWIAKPQLQSERENAVSLAEAVGSFVRRYNDAEVEWSHEKEHSPDLRGSVPSELQARLGPPQTPRRVKDLGNSVNRNH